LLKLSPGEIPFYETHLEMHFNVCGSRTYNFAWKLGSFESPQKTSKFFVFHQKESMAGHVGLKGVY
jgi:hypothetical protein